MHKVAQAEAGLPHKLDRICKTSEPAQRIVSFTAELMGGFCVIAHALVLALQTWQLEFSCDTN